MGNTLQKEFISNVIKQYHKLIPLHIFGETDSNSGENGSSKLRNQVGDNEWIY